MSDNKDNILVNLRRLGLDGDEARVYISLLKKSGTHLEVARRTGINRTKVYRIVDDLVARSLIIESQDDTGRRLIAGDPAHLEIQLKTDEEALENKKRALESALPDLSRLFQLGGLPSALSFEVSTYEGVSGFKQMLWNELKAKEEIVIFGSGTLEDLVGSSRFAERHRERTLQAGYVIREILNPDGKPEAFTNNQAFIEKSYQRRHIDPNILQLSSQVCIYNNVVAIYHWQHGKKVGIEITSKSFAAMQRGVFEHFWAHAQV